MSETKRPARGGWRASKKERMQEKALFRHVVAQEAKWRAIVQSKVREYSPEQIVAYAQDRGLQVSPSVLKKVKK